MSIQSAPLVSAIIPTYSRPALLKRAILSVLAQDGPPLQVCVYDNASGDETASVVAEIAAKDPRVRYHCHERNIGPFENFQYGLMRVNTPFFSFLSDDDVLLPGFYEQAIRSFDRFPDAMFWAGITIRMTPNGTVYDARVESWPREGLFEPPESLFEMIGGLVPTWTGVMFRRQVVDKVGLLDKATSGCMDLDFSMRIAARYPIVVSKYPAAIFLMNPESFSEVGPFTAFWPGWLKMLRNVAATESLSNDARARLELLMNSDIRRMLFRRAASALSKRDYKFVDQAAQVLQQHYGKSLQSRFLLMLALLCSGIGLVQHGYTTAYNTAVQLSLRKRASVQQRYGNLVRYL